VIRASGCLADSASAIPGELRFGISQDRRRSSCNAWLSLGCVCIKGGRQRDDNRYILPLTRTGDPVSGSLWALVMIDPARKRSSWERLQGRATEKPKRPVSHVCYSERFEGNFSSMQQRWEVCSLYGTIPILSTGVRSRRSTSFRNERRGETWSRTRNDH
jgi:hypothetical protein